MRYKYHFSAFLFALFVGIICVAPQAYLMFSPSYQGVVMMGTDGEEHYIARLQEIYEGYPLLGNVFLQPKNEPDFAPGGNEVIDFLVGKLFGVSAAVDDVLSKFLLPCCITLLIYALAYVLFESRPAALLSAAGVMLGDNLAQSPSALLGLLHGRASPDFLYYTRPMNPEVSALFLFGGLLFIYLVCYKRSPRLFETILLGIFVGVSFYSSIYIFTFLSGVIGFSLLWSLYEREYQHVKRLVTVFVIAFLALIPYLVNYVALKRNPLYAESALRQGLFVSHAPLFSVWLCILLICTVCFWPKRFASARRLFLFSILALFILLNQQVITGIWLQPNHYHWYITEKLMFFVFAMYTVVIVETLTQKKWLRQSLYAAGLLILLYNGSLIQLRSYQAHAAAALQLQPYASVFTYLNELPALQTVFADRQLSLEIPIYTSDDTPNNIYAEYYLVPQAYLVETLLLEYKLRGVTPDEALVTMQQERSDISGKLFGVYWSEKSGTLAAIPDSLLEQYATQYKQTYSETLAQRMNNLGITLFIQDTANDDWDISPSSGLTKVATISGRFIIYTP